MKKFILFLIIITISSCTKKEIIEFKVPADYKTWKKPINEILDYPVAGHGSTYRIIYANKIAFTAKVDKKNNRIVMPDGSIVIKETYIKKKDIPKKVDNLTIMVKDSKNENSQDGWLYYMKKPGKKSKRIGGRMCHGCHEAANEDHPYFDKNPKGMFRDYLFVKIAK